MSQSMVVGIMKDAFLTVLFAAGPILIIALVVGLIISILQATTQVQEQTLTFVPKILAVFVSIIILMPYMMGKIGDFAESIFENISNMVR